MKRYRGKMTQSVVISALAVSLGGAALAQPCSSVERVSLPEGTVLRAQLNDPLSSTSSRRGDRFTGTIEADSSGLPAGAQVVGEVAGVQKADSRHPGSVDVDFQLLRLRDGRAY